MSIFKDSQEVVSFMALFSRLKDWCDDDPDGLEEFVKSDPSIKDLCIELADAACMLEHEEMQGRQVFSAPVDPKFRDSWRDYEERYELALKRIWWIEIAEQIPELAARNASVTHNAETRWSRADAKAAERAEGIEDAIRFAWEQADPEREFPAGFSDRIDDGVAAWDALKRQTGFDLRGVFRRRVLVPFVLVPRHVAAKHGSDEKLSLLHNLQQAHDAFIFGATYGALALMRSIAEGVLRDHYGANGRDLNERIQDARCQLPRAANEGALHRLRKLANAILHFDREKDQGLPKMDDARLEKEIVSLLLVLRALIEGAPRRAW